MSKSSRSRCYGTGRWHKRPVSLNTRLYLSNNKRGNVSNYTMLNDNSTKQKQLALQPSFQDSSYKDLHKKAELPQR